MEFDLYLRFLFALIFVLALIGLLSWLVKRFGLAGRLASSGGRQKRLEVIEALPLDGKHRLVLLRRDSTEHLVMLGATADLVIESGINRPVPMEPEGPEQGGLPS